MKTEIIINKIQCIHCKDVLISYNRHDFRMCFCGKCGVDGGKDYLRRLGEETDYIEMSEFKENTENNDNIQERHKGKD